jgi:anti-sigma regulatory factor (Ser/Thr protein kinase)
LELQTDSHPESLGDARRRVRDAMTRAGLAIEAAWDMEVAVGEALSNVYQHAYSTGVGPVSVEVLTTGAALTVVVHDEGGATTPPAIPRTLPPRTKTGGRGLYMAGRLADDVEVRVNPAGHGVTVRMTARLRTPFKTRSSGMQAKEA